MRPAGSDEGKPSANPQRIVLVVVLVIVIETSQVEHEDENDDEDDPHSGSAESIPMKSYVSNANGLFNASYKHVNFHPFFLKRAIDTLAALW